MEYLLSLKNAHILESVALRHTLFGFDFDGTLAPISSNPSHVGMSTDCENFLKKLNERCPVAIITGRSIRDVKNFFNFNPKYLIGNHGIEGSLTQDQLNSIVEVINHYKKLILDQFGDTFLSMGIELEDKVYSLTLHYRNSHNPYEAERFITANLSYFSMAKVTKGKMVVNIIPNDGIHKGQAFMQLLTKEKTQYGFYVGDDVTDEDVFAYKSPQLLTVRIGYSDVSQAEYYLNDQEEIVQVLKILSQNIS